MGKNITVTAIHPGEHVAEELKQLGMSAADLAPKLDVPTNRITGILNGHGRRATCPFLWYECRVLARLAEHP
jgi:plasmid maintenance system antidote protein VapI